MMGGLPLPVAFRQPHSSGAQVHLTFKRRLQYIQAPGMGPIRKIFPERKPILMRYPWHDY